MRSACLLCCLLLGAVSAGAQVPPASLEAPVVIPRLDGPITLDGRSDEAAWEALPPLPLGKTSPTYGGRASLRTEIRVAHDDAFLYLAARCYGPPDSVFAASFKRDLFTPATDYVGIILDTFNDNENALAFFTTPTGVRTDFTVFNDAQGDFPANVNWNAFWDAEVVQDETGWFAEMRIPFTSLRFVDDDGRVTMGLITWRYSAKLPEMVMYPPISPEWGAWSIFMPSRAQKVVFEDIYSRRPLYVTPYALGGLGQEARLNAPETGYHRVDDPTYDLGLDVKYGLTSNLTLDLTVNTDFAQVEADDQQVNLTRFSLFFPEKRLFFQERSSNFDVSLGGIDRLFYSRRIGLREGEPVRILGGARIVGRVGAWDVGLLDMQTARSSALDVPSENAGVLRLRRQVLNPYSYAGGIVTSRVGLDGSYNVVYGLDAIIRLFGSDYLAVAAAQSAEDGLGYDPLDAGRLHLHWERRRFEGLAYRLGFDRAGRTFDPALGFQLRSDYTQFSGQASYGRLFGEDARLQNASTVLSAALYLRNADRSVETTEMTLSQRITTKKGTSYGATLTTSYDDLREGFDLSDDIAVASGAYTYHTLNAFFNTVEGSARRLNTEVGAGTFYGGRRLSVGLTPTWTLSRYLEVGGFYQFNRIGFPERDDHLSVHLARLRLQITLNTKVSASAFLQYNGAADAVVTNLRLRYNPREGTDFFLVYNEGLNTDRRREDPVLPLTDSRTLVAKYTYTFLY